MFKFVQILCNLQNSTEVRQEIAERLLHPTDDWGPALPENRKDKYPMSCDLNGADRTEEPQIELEEVRTTVGPKIRFAEKISTDETSKDSQRSSNSLEGNKDEGTCEEETTEKLIHPIG